jgi:putative hydrolase of the HAD superfamily
MRAVIFDLWDTIAAWPSAEWKTVTERTRTLLGMEADEFTTFWSSSNRLRSTRPMREALAELGVSGDVVDELLEVRRALTHRALVPIPGTLETIEALRERDVRVGLISVCTDEVVELWEETPFGDLFDDAVFSCAVGLAKPDPRIYRLACERLGVEPEETLFVGDGANDELAGAAAVGMHAVLVLPPGRDEPLWPEAHDWQPRISELPHVLDLIDERSSR